MCKILLARNAVEKLFLYVKFSREIWVAVWIVVGTVVWVVLVVIFVLIRVVIFVLIWVVVFVILIVIWHENHFLSFILFYLFQRSKKYSKNSSNYYFKLETDYDSHNIILNIYDNNFKLIDNDTKWSFELLEEKLLRKLQKLAFIEVKKKYISGEIYYRYENVTLYNIKNFDNFINLIDKGKIKIVFRIGIYKKGPKFGQIYDHGTSFCIKVSHLEQLLQKVI